MIGARLLSLGALHFLYLDSPVPSKFTGFEIVGQGALAKQQLKYRKGFSDYFKDMRGKSKAEILNSLGAKTGREVVKRWESVARYPNLPRYFTLSWLF